MGWILLPTADMGKYLGLSLKSPGGRDAQQATGGTKGWVAQHQWLPLLRIQTASAATHVLLLQARIALRMSYGMELWRRAGNGAAMTAALTRDTMLVTGIHSEAPHVEHGGFVQGPFLQPGCGAAPP